jgi:clan AA aspartic protease (TIGR02281 family)
LKNTGLLILGICIGWLLHDNFPHIVRYISSSPEEITSSLESPAVGHENQDEITGMGDRATSRLQWETSAITTLEPTQPFSESITGLLAELKAGNYAQSVTRCGSGDSDFNQDCRRNLVEFAQSGALTDSEARFLLELWMAENPDDLEVGTVLVDQDIHNQRYVDAARRLALMQSYLTEPRKLEAIARTTQNFARRAIVKLDLQGDFADLQALLELLIDMDPGRAAWRYSLASVQNDQGYYDSAITTLSFILFDQEYGDRATRLYESIVEKLNLASFSEVPLRNTGFQFLVKARVNNRHELNLILDTGATVTALRGNVLERFGLVSGNDRAIVLNTVGGRVNSTLVRLSSLSVGGQVVREIDVANTDLGDIAADGLLGMNFLEHFRFIIDQKRRRLYLERK